MLRICAETCADSEQHLPDSVLLQPHDLDGNDRRGIMELNIEQLLLQIGYRLLLLMTEYLIMK